MLDLNGSNSVLKDEYVNFWTNFLTMYGEMFSYHIAVDENSKKEAINAFNLISEGKDAFDYA